MRVTLRLADGLYSDEGMMKVVTLSERAFVIGRAPEADWTLTDPSNQISGVHLELRCRGGDLLLVDQSSGGTALGSASNRLQKGQPTNLPDQCMLLLPVGSLSVQIQREGAGAERLGDDGEEDDFFRVGEIRRERGLGQGRPTPRPITPRGLLEESLPDDPLSRVGHVAAADPMAAVSSKLMNANDLLGDGSAAQPEPRRETAQPVRTSRRAEPAALPISAYPPSWPEGMEMPTADPPPRQAPAPAEKSRSWLDDDEEDDPFGNVPVSPAPLEPESQPEPEPEPLPEFTQPVVQHADLPSSAVEPHPSEHPPADPVASPGLDAAIEALFRELGLDADMPADDRIALCGEIGRTYAAMADAMRQMLETRAEMKRALGVVATEIEIGANPLKIARDRDGAVQGLARPLASGYLSGEAAVEDSLHSMQAHQYALVSGIKAALQKTLDTFDPKALEEKLTQRGMSAWLASRRKAALWDRFVDNYEMFSDQAADNFRVLIGRELDNLYAARRPSSDRPRRERL